MLPRTWAIGIEIRKVRRDWNRSMTEARTRKATGDELARLSYEWHLDYKTLVDEREAIFSDRLVAQANRLRVPVPEQSRSGEEGEEGEDENWREGEFGMRHLKPEGIRKVRAEIRAELKARSERRLAWLTPLTGIIGALTGLAAVLVRNCSR
jgi:hypothetical protein